MNWLGTPLGGRARVEQELTRVTLLVHRRMAVAEHDYIRVGKTAPHPRSRDRSPLQCHGPSRSVRRPTRPLADEQHPHKGNVIVAQYGVDRGQLPQQLKDPRIKDVTSMQDGVRSAKTLPRRVRQSCANAAAWPGGPDVSVGEDDDSTRPEGDRVATVARIGSHCHPALAQCGHLTGPDRRLARVARGRSTLDCLGPLGA